MTSFKLFGAALILSTAFATPVSAQVAGLVELPGDYAFLLNRDDSWAFLSPAPGNAITVEPGRVLVAQVRRPTGPQRAPHISSAGAH